VRPAPLSRIQAVKDFLTTDGHRWTQMDTDKKRGLQAPRKAHHLVTGENPGQNDVLTFLHLCLSVSICG
jgi:hypothetical protein